MMHELQQIDLVGVALAHTFVLAFMVWGGCNISGAHYNLAITLATLVTGHIGYLKALYYSLFQFLGALLAGCLLQIFKYFYPGDSKMFHTVLGYPHADIDGFGIQICFGVELMATFFLVFMVYSTLISKTKPVSEVYGITIGGSLGMAILSIGPITGAALNPWRVLGPACVSGELIRSEFWYAWIYYLGCPLGGVLAGIVWKLVFMWEDEVKGSTDIKEEDLPLNESDAKNTEVDAKNT